MLALHWLQRSQDDHAPILLCIHGWGAHADVWRPLAGHLSDYSVVAIELPGCGANTQPSQSFEHFVEACKVLIQKELSDAHIFIAGWSLGGKVAMALAASSDLNIAGLIGVATNPCFVQQAIGSACECPSKSCLCDDEITDVTPATGMKRVDFDAFLSDFEADAPATFKRFTALQASGAHDMRSLRKTMRLQLVAPTSDQQISWLASLHWLARDMRPVVAKIIPPQCYIQADGDALVPLAARQHYSGVLHTITHSSHCIPLERPAELARAITVFIQTHTAKYDKQRVASAFSQAATTYDTFSHVQKHIAQRVIHAAASLPGKGFSGKEVLDLGAGTGSLSHALIQQGACLTALDIAEGMLKQAVTSSRIQTGVVADAESLPFAQASFDGIVSSLAVQWCNDINRLFAECYRVLKPGGQAIIATLGPGTLHELKQAWLAVDAYVHVNGFASRASLCQAIEQSGLVIDQIQQAPEVFTYPKMMPILKELKGIGAHNSHDAAPKGLMTSSKLKALESAYRLSQPEQEGFSVTYDVLLLSLSKPA